jgi:putative transposase
MGKRIKTYEEAKLRNPERWAKNIRNSTLPEYVSLNPIAENEANDSLHKSC